MVCLERARPEADALITVCQKQLTGFQHVEHLGRTGSEDGRLSNGTPGRLCLTPSENLVHWCMEPARPLQGVPYALDASGRVAPPVDARRDAVYRCLACGGAVRPVRAHTRALAGGRQVPVVAHFAHREPGTCGATGESVEHRACKRVLLDRLRTARAFTVSRTCVCCQQPDALDYVLGEGWTVEEEVTLDNYRLDVAILNVAGQVAFAFEIRHRHAVGEPKARSLPTRWVEVGTDVESLLVSPGAPSLSVLDTNLYAFHPCPCGNREWSHR